MILPPHERSTGVVAHPARHLDTRIPIGFDADDEPRRLAFSVRPPQCPDGRHLFDVIHAGREYDDVDAPDLRSDLRAVLTCVRCGHIEHWEGTLVHRRQPSRVDPEPIEAGPFRAQQITRASVGEPISSWRIHQDLTDPVTGRLHRDVPVGGIHWIASPGGPTCYEAQLDTDPDDRTGTGATPLVALQQLAATQAS